MCIKIRGLAEFRRKLDTLQRRAQNLNGPVPFEDLFPPEFMRRHTDFKTIEDMLSAFGVPINSTDDFERIPHDQWDTHVKRTTRFANWKTMQTQASEDFVERRLSLDNL
jgi:hypothetical protein